MTREAIERRALILERAAQLFDDSGYTATSMIDIANTIGIRKPSLYYYFSNKGEILVSIHAAFIDGLIENQERRLGEINAEALIKDVLLEIVTLIRNKRGHVRTFFENYRELPEEYKTVAEVKETGTAASSSSLWSGPSVPPNSSM